MTRPEADEDWDDYQPGTPGDDFDEAEAVGRLVAEHGVPLSTDGALRGVPYTPGDGEATELDLLRADPFAVAAQLADAADRNLDEAEPVNAPTVLAEAVEELARLGDAHHESPDALNLIIDGFERWARARADELTVRHPCPHGCAGGHTDYEYGDQHRNPEGD